MSFASADPSRLIESSVPAGWTSLHLDHQEGIGESDIFETHLKTDLTLVVAMSGHHEIGVFSRGRWKSALYQPGNAGMTPPGEVTRMRWRTLPGQPPFRTLHFYLPGSLLSALADEYSQAGRHARADDLSALSFRDNAIAAQAVALLAACRAGEPDIYAAGAARWIVTHLLSQHAQWRHLHSDPRLASVITDRRLARVIEYMTAHLESAMTLDELAREAGISVHHFGRRFRESTGLGPAAYLTTLRMAHARLLLRTTDLPIAEIGFRCGYSRASAFATAFLRHVGTTASSYRASP
ncbi:helix-turn-helix domain-containing protein [Sphingomonas profundi]|uniref:helix-turn-helix domain-containing protein n=1 Tax=Alterirhizorhabdus profundi TaxID=2681549 RepID=UPI0018D0FE88|nr:helix-turn-helix domain-containing protein [Sphingomonas profundi]